jgi:hypothetical protein
MTTGTLGDHAHEFRRDDVLDESASLARVLEVFSAADNAFIEWRGEVAGVITRRDLQSPPLRMWLFGAITVLDANLTWAVEESYPADSWRAHMTRGRLEKAVALCQERERRGSERRLLDCLQLKDKADLLVNDPACLALLGLASRREADRLTRDVEKLRNHLAHAQELEPAHLATATRLASQIQTVLRAGVAQRIVATRRAAGSNSPTS